MFFLFPSVPPPPYFFNNIYVRLFLYAEQFCLSTFFKHLPFSPFFLPSPSPPFISLQTFSFFIGIFVFLFFLSDFYIYFFGFLPSCLLPLSLSRNYLKMHGAEERGVGYEVGRDLHFSLVFQKIVFPLFFFSNLFEKNMGFFLF